MNNPYIDPNYRDALTMQIDSDVPLPTEAPLRTCIDCKCQKPETEFSLKRGKHSSERKNFCVKCEVARAKFSKSKETIFAEHQAMVALPCSICGQKQKKRKIDYSVTNRSLGVICVDCDQILKRLVIQPDLIMRINNYLTLKNNFPGLATRGLHAMIGQQPNDTPLLDNLE